MNWAIPCFYIAVFDGIPRNSKQIESTSGAILGEARKEGIFLLFNNINNTIFKLHDYLFFLANKAKVFYGLLKEPELNVPLDEDEEEPEDKPKASCSTQLLSKNFCHSLLMLFCAFKKRKAKKDQNLVKKSKADPNAPANSRVPLPEW